MLSVNINRDVEQYQESVFFGLNAKQTIAVFMALIVGMGIICLLYFAVGMPVEIGIYISLPVCIPIILPALGKKYGLTVTERIRQSNKRKKVVAYSSVAVQEKRPKAESGQKQNLLKKKVGKIWNGKGNSDKEKRQVPKDKE